MKLIRLIYISSATRWPSEEDLRSLLVQARERNRREQVTGMLLYRDATYLQLLEGPEESVHAIFQAICRDPRNTGVVKLLEQAIQARDFPSWHMGFKHLESSLAEEPAGYVDIFSPDFDRASLLVQPGPAVNLLLRFAKTQP